MSTNSILKPQAPAGDGSEEFDTSVLRPGLFLYSPGKNAVFQDMNGTSAGSSGVNEGLEVLAPKLPEGGVAGEGALEGGGEGS